MNKSQKRFGAFGAGFPLARKREAGLGRARRPLHNIGSCEPVVLSPSAGEEIGASRDEAATPKALSLEEVSQGRAVHLIPGGSRRRFAFWTNVRRLSSRLRDQSKLMFDSEFHGGSLNLYVDFFFFFRLKLEETREVQNMRKRPNGVRWVP